MYIFRWRTDLVKKTDFLCTYLLFTQVIFFIIEFR